MVASILMLYEKSLKITKLFRVFSRNHFIINNNTIYNNILKGIHCLLPLVENMIRPVKEPQRSQAEIERGNCLGCRLLNRRSVGWVVGCGMEAAVGRKE